MVGCEKEWERWALREDGREYDPLREEDRPWKDDGGAGEPMGENGPEYENVGDVGFDGVRDRRPDGWWNTFELLDYKYRGGQSY